MNKIIYIQKPKSKVNKKEIEQLKKLHFRDGLMYPRFLDTAGYVILAWLDDKIVSWAFIFRDNRRKYNTFFVYVAPKFRNKKIGTNLFKLAQNRYGNLWVSKHDGRAKGFYESLGQ